VTLRCEGDFEGFKSLIGPTLKERDQNNARFAEALAIDRNKQKPTCTSAPDSM